MKILGETKTRRGWKLFFMRGILGALGMFSLVGCGDKAPVEAPTLVSGSEVIMDGSTKGYAIGVGLLKTTLAKPVRKL